MKNFDIRKFRERWPDFHSFPSGEIRAFFKVCSGPRPRGRDEALGILLNPDEADLPDYYLRLSRFVARSRFRIAEIPVEFFHVFFELAASFPEISNSPDLQGLLERAIAKAPRNLLGWLLEKRFPIGPFRGSIERVHAPHNMRRLLRALFARLPSGANPGQMHGPDSSLEITLADLGPLLLPPTRKNQARRCNPALRRTARNLLCRGAAAPASTLPFSKIYWPGAGSRTLSYWDRLADAQARELAEVAGLAQRVSARTGRVVLSWHNASLAAAGGWGHEDIGARFASPAAYREFARSTLETARQMRARFGNEAKLLLKMRNRRIFAPRAIQALEWVRLSAHLFPSPRDGWLEASRKAAVLLDPDEIESVWAGGKCEWPGALAPHQIVGLDRVLEWFDNAQKTWADGFCLFLALAVQGQRALDSGTVSSMVLPWIDKFFISSLRRADQEYLERLYRLVESALGKPLVLFWEDTAHARLPSLMLALDELRGRGLPFRGIGIFDPDNSKRGDAAQIVREEYPNSTLFALRPLDDNHFPGSFRGVFELLDRDFLCRYDSSWKDNLAFIYTGTQVFALLSVQTEMESVGSWVSDGRRRYPFGAWFRARLRKPAASLPHEPQDPLRHAYASWANLL